MASLAALLLLLLPARAAANGCYDTCCFAPSCPAETGGGDRSASTSSSSSSPGGGGAESVSGAECPAGHTKKMQSCAVPCCVPDPGTAGSCCQLGRAPGPHPNGTLAVPNEVQLAWQDLEIGALNSFQMVTFWGGQLSADRPFNISSPSEFTAKDMDTDQWAQAVATMGGKYQVLNVKDESVRIYAPAPAFLCDVIFSFQKPRSSFTKTGSRHTQKRKRF
jgi:hypothetical protein